MRRYAAAVVASLVNICACALWRKGVVHYSINKLDYDVHSQDQITSALSKLQEEICIKFFQQAPNITDDKLLFISNPGKIKHCQPRQYDFTKNVILMPIGYKCVNSKAIARAVAEMLRASIEQTVSSINSYDLIKKFQEKDLDPRRPTLLSSVDRNFINAHYHRECSALAQPVPPVQRRSDPDTPAIEEIRAFPHLSDENLKYYESKLWPRAILIYGVEHSLRNTELHRKLQEAIEAVEKSTCVVFRDIESSLLLPRSHIWFGEEGEDEPTLGFQGGKQLVKLRTMVEGCPGHEAHAVNNLLRALGLPMMSNRYDRDNYVTVNWRHVVGGKEYLLEKAPREAWVTDMPYDFTSASHASGDFACADCRLGETTVAPLADPVWHNLMSMGRRSDLADSDVQMLNMLYSAQCILKASGNNTFN